MSSSPSAAAVPGTRTKFRRAIWFVVVAILVWGIFMRIQASGFDHGSGKIPAFL